MAPDTQGRLVYVRRRKRDRPVCIHCGTGYFAGSTQGRVTYYYPRCRCLVRNAKVIREMVRAA